MSIRKKPSEPLPDLLTAREVARRLSVGVRTLWRMVYRGEVPSPVRFNCRLVRWRRSDIDEYIQKLQ